MLTGACSVQVAVRPIEIRHSPEKRQVLILTREMPAVKIHLRGRESLKRAIVQARVVLSLTDRGSEVGVATEQFDLVLGLRGDCHARDERSESKELEEQRQQLQRV